MKIRHYSTWIKEGNNRFLYKHYKNNLARLAAAGFSVYYEGDKILYTKQDCVSIIEKKHESTCEFVYCFAGHYTGAHTLFSKTLH